MDHATVINTPEGIARFRLIALKGAVRLEALGMKRRGPSARSIAAKELGVPARTSCDRLIFLLTQRIAEG